MGRGITALALPFELRDLEVPEAIADECGQIRRGSRDVASSVCGPDTAVPRCVPYASPTVLGPWTATWAGCVHGQTLQGCCKGKLRVKNLYIVRIPGADTRQNASTDALVALSSCRPFILTQALTVKCRDLSVYDAASYRHHGRASDRSATGKLTRVSRWRAASQHGLA